MALKVQGTDLYAIDPADDSLITVGCITSIDGIDSAVESIVQSCINETVASKFSGIITPGTASFGINVDPSDTGHARLHEIKSAGTDIKWAIGWSDGTAAPTVDSNGDFEVATSRSWITFPGFMSAFPFAFAAGALVASSISIEISNDPVLVPKSA